MSICKINSTRRLLPPVILASFLSLLGSCKDQVTEPPSNITFPPSGVSYAGQVQPLFNQACALSGCHDSGPHQSDLCLTDHFSTVFRTPGVVTPGHPELSTLVFRIEGTAGERMPLNAAPLNQEQINGIRTWIVEGAQNN